MAGCVRGGMSVSKPQWEVLQQSKAPKLTIKEDIHDIIGRLASPGVLEAAQENIDKMLNTVTLPATANKSLSTLNQCAQGLQKTDKANFYLNFKSIILLIEAVRITHQYVHWYISFYF